MIIKAVDLFCGVGGLTYGLKKAGIPVVAGIDIDGSCEYAYTHNNDCKFIQKSIDDITGKEIRALLRGAEIKILVGCAPCQPFSSHQAQSLVALVKYKAGTSNLLQRNEKILLGLVLMYRLLFCPDN